MRRILPLVVFIIAGASLLSAQSPQGRMGGGRPGGDRPPMRRAMPGNENKGSGIGIMKLPEIPGLAADQREKLVKAITDERKEVTKLVGDKHEILMLAENSTEQPTQKEIEKQAKKIAKIDEKIEKARIKSNEKVKSILTPDQYLVFEEKKEEIEFNQSDKRMNKPLRGGRGQRPELPDGNMPPDLPMDGELM